MPHRELQKVLSGNRITLPAEYVKRAGIKKGNIVIVEWDMLGRVTIQQAEVKPKRTELEGIHDKP